MTFSKRALLTVAQLALVSSAYSAVSYDISFGVIRNAAGAQVSENSLWAVVYDDNNDGIIAGLSVAAGSRSLTAAESAGVVSSFGGATIAQGTLLGGDRILRAFEVDGENTSGQSGITATSQENFTYTADGGLNNDGIAAGRSWAIFWFPQLTLGSNVLAANSFEIGGFYSSVENTPSGGDTGMVFPANTGAGLSPAFLDEGFIDVGLVAPEDPAAVALPQSRFQATNVSSGVQWDGANTGPGAQGGNGTWSATESNWWAGSATGKWSNSGANNDATFGGAAGVVTISGGVTANDLAFTTTGYQITGSTLTLNGTTPTVTTGSGIVATINSEIQGSAGLAKAGAGTLALGGANTYSGTTAVNQGTLLVNNTTGSGTGTSAVTVASGASLGGSGTISGAVSVTGIIAPGNSIGTLTTGTTTWNGVADLASASSATDWQFELATPAASDKLIINGDFLKGTGSVFRFDFMSSTPLAGVYTLIDWNGLSATGFSESNFAYTGLSGAYTGSFFTINGTRLDFTVVPEVSNIFAGGLLAAGLLRRRRRSA